MVKGAYWSSGMNSLFSEQILADKLSKLNGTQQCIESILLNLLFVCILD